MNKPAWIAVDWGTSHVRAWFMDMRDQVIERRQSKEGMGGLKPDQFGPALQRLVDQVDCPVIACGMVGSRQGWAEAPYMTTPCPPPDASRATRVENVHILPGICQLAPADVMRGEETQIAGFMAAQPEFDGIICLPGTHTKWVHVSAGEVVSFRTSMTGEIFSLLTQASVLQHSISDGWDDETFDEAVGDAMSKPEALAARLFSIRAESLLQDVAPGVARARLSGLLIGAELAAMRPYWLGQAVALIGETALCGIYSAALERQGVTSHVADGDAMTLRGLIAAKSILEMT